jgi:hypothetical protein
MQEAMQDRAWTLKKRHVMRMQVCYRAMVLEHMLVAEQTNSH